MTDTLKPVRCGCGGEAKYLTHEDGTRRIYCPECGIRTGWKPTEAEAITAWNRAMNGVVVAKNATTDVECAKDARMERTAKVSEIATRAYCGECKERLDDYDDVCGEPPIKYCPMCGARLVWE